MLTDSLNDREKQYRTEIEYDEQVISYLKDYPLSVVQHHNNMNYEISRRTLARKLKTFQDPVIVNEHPCWITRHISGRYFIFYDTNVCDYITLKIHNDDSTKAILRLAYPEYSESCIGKVNTRLVCRYTFVDNNNDYPEAPLFCVQQK